MIKNNILMSSTECGLSPYDEKNSSERNFLMKLPMKSWTHTSMGQDSISQLPIIRIERDIILD